MVKWSFPGSLYFENTRKNVKSNLVLVVVLVLESKGRGGEWYPEKRGSRKILAGSRNLGSVFDKSRNLVFAWFVFTFLSLETFYQRVSGSDNYDLGVSANLGFYHSPPLKVSSDGPETVERCIFSWFTWNIFYNFYIATTLTTTTILLNLVQSKGRAFTGKMK